ncbi:MAG: hypothetical protein ACKO46_06325 [Alphaproteobacteria bacterium]
MSKNFDLIRNKKSANSREEQFILNAKNSKKFQKILIIFCYLFIFFALIFYLSNFFSDKKTIRIVNQIKSERDKFLAEKIMINPNIKIKNDDGKIFNITAKNAKNYNNEQVIMNEVFAESDDLKISAGELKILDNGNHLIFSKNPILILTNYE